MQNRRYKPHIPKNKQYIKEVSELIKERKPLEKIKFEYLNELLNALGFLENPYSLISLEDLNPKDLQLLIEKTFLKINNIKLSQELEEKLFRLWDYLAESDSIEKAELIFVFGGPGINRVNESIRLYKEKFSGKILFTGKKASYMKDVDISEAEYYANIAEENGVNSKDIIVENTAKNTPENAVKSVEILKQNKFLPKSIIVITLPYHMRRSYLTLKSVIDWDAKLIRDTIESAKYSRENYFKDKNGFSYVFSEYIKLYGARLMKHF